MSDAEEEAPEPRIRRILVALDASPHSLAALQAAGELAASLDAELVGLYVEDITLLRLAGLPLLREVSIFSALPRQIDREQLEQQLRMQARIARRALADLARRTRVRWSFRVSQGVITAELLTAAGENDLIILGKSGWSRRRRLGSTARVIVTQAPSRAMVVQVGSSIRLPAAVLYDGSALSTAALDAAASLAQGRGSALVVIIMARSLEQARELQTEVAGWLRKRGMAARYRWLVQPDPIRLMNFIDAEGCRMLVLPADSPLLPPAAMLELVDRIDLPVLLVR